MRHFFIPALIATSITFFPVVTSAQSIEGGTVASTKTTQAFCTQPCKIPILMYHYISDINRKTTREGRTLSVTPKVFAEQLDALKMNGYTTIRFADILSGSTLPQKPIILTFDDGYLDAAEKALPALLLRQMVGTFFIISGRIGRNGYMTLNDLRLLTDNGMEIGAHTVNHPDLRKLTPQKQRFEIGESAAYLRKILGVPVQVFAYPSGKYKPLTPSIVRSEEMPFAVSTHVGIPTEASNPLLLPRIRMTNAMHGESLVKYLERMMR